MGLKIDLRLLNDALVTWGMRMQMVMAIEEMAELTKEIVKNLRGNNNRDQIIEETADVCITLEQLRMIHGITDDELNAVIHYKSNRIRERIARENAPVDSQKA